MSDGAYIVEYVVVGKSMKITAIDPKSGIEVSIIASPSTPKTQLNKLAVRKLEYMIKKKRIPNEKN